MNLLINIVLFQLFYGQILMDLACFKTENCSCQKHMGIEEVEVTCNSSTVKANLVESFVHIHCNLDQTQWEQSFGQISVTQFIYNNCPLDRGIHHMFTILGINGVQDIRLIRTKLNGSLESFYFSNMKNVMQMYIIDTKSILRLTNESFQGTPYLKTLILRKNSIKELPKGVFKVLTNLEVLDLGGNEISTIENNLFDGILLKGLVLDSNHLTTLSLNIPSLKHLDVSNNKLASITVEHLHKLIDISLNKNTLVTMTDQPFRNTSLKVIKFNYGNFTTLPKKFLFDMDQLQKVQLKSLNLKVVPEDMIWSSHNVVELSLASNCLKELPATFFQDSKNIKELDLSGNQLGNINHTLFKPLIKLESLDLSRNLIVQLDHYGLRFLKNLIHLNLERNNLTIIEREALNVPKLKSLKLAHNKINSLSMNYSFSFHYLDKVEYVDLSSNSITGIDEGWLNLVKLKYVNLENNNFTILGMGDIQFLNEEVKINLNSNPFKVIDLSNLMVFVKAQPVVDNIWKKTSRQISLSGNKLICDCRNYDFANYLHIQMPKAVYKYLEIEQNFTCTDGQVFEHVNIDSLTCDWDIFNDVDKIDCPDCMCTYRPRDNSAVMNCSNKNLKLAPLTVISSKNTNYTDVILRNNLITELPNYKHFNIKKLDVGYNNLSTIDIMLLPKSLVELNLEHNNLITINGTNFDDMLNNISLLKMSKNPWSCDSQAKNTFNFIHHYSQKIVDLNSVQCSDSTPIRDKMKEEEYKEFKTFKFIVGAVSLAVFSLFLILLWALFNSYKTEIKIWLYSHNITWSISEESLDQNKTYDAFISFSHKDLDFVENELVPGLEGGSMPFKLCLHYRDWVVGDYIPNQIARSVDESRRTVIVLSQNFLESIWAGTEFRTACVSALNEGRTRIIVILYGKVSTDNLDSELKAYLSMNTYIEWGDRWFWKKLRYALPHRQENKIKTKPIMPDKLNPLQFKVAS